MKLFCKNCNITRWCGIFRSTLMPQGHTIRAFSCGHCARTVLTGVKE